MSGPKETLGYPSRTDAVLALAAQGLDRRAIGERIGIAPSTVAALVASAQRAKGRSGEPSASQRGKYRMGTAQLETAVMDLHEEGRTRDQIAERLNIRRETADKIIGYMQIGRSDHAIGPKAIAHGSAMLLAAIRRFHPERCDA